MNPHNSPRTEADPNEFCIEGQAVKKLETSQASPSTVVQGISTKARGKYQEDESTLEDFGFVDKLPLINHLYEINKNLEKQIETLRLRLVFDVKHHEDDKNAAIQETDTKLKARESELLKLRSELESKEDAVNRLSKANKEKEEEISGLQSELVDMQKDIGVTRQYARDLQKELTTLQKENKRLEDGFAYDDKEQHIDALKKEVEEMTKNLATIEHELEKAREIISTQGGKMRILENDKKNMHVKFKEEMTKLSLATRHEIEKMRDVMKGQWDEMKFLREQNEGMTKDIKEIKELLLTNRIESSTSRSPPYGHNFKPTLPTLTSDTKRILTGKRK